MASIALLFRAANEREPFSGQTVLGDLIHSHRIPVGTLGKPQRDASRWFPAVFIGSPMIEFGASTIYRRRAFHYTSFT
jgi:hypothetical protein